MHQKSYLKAKKLKSIARKSTVLVLIFLFVFSPLEPILAEETSTPLIPTEQEIPIPQPDTAVPALFNSALKSINSRPLPSNEKNVVLPEEVLKMLDIPGNNAVPSNITVPKENSGKADNASKKQIELYGNFNKKSASSAEFSATSSSGQLIGGGNKPEPFQGLPADVQLLSVKDNTGALNYGYALAVPPGRNGFEPDLSLNYNSQTLDDSGMFGYGWSVNIPSIERINKKGTDKLYAENYFSSSLTGELVALGGTSYGSKVDNGEFLKYEFSGNAWIITDKKGTKYRFGTTAASRQDNPLNTANVYKWMLDEIRDTNDNFINYSYFKNSGQIYPYKINYTGNGALAGIFEIEFLRQARADAITSYKSGFAVKTAYRINEVQTKINGLWVKSIAVQLKLPETHLEALFHYQLMDGFNV